MNTRRSVIPVFLLIAFCTSVANTQATRFSAVQIREDITFLRSELEQRHPNLYLYSDKAAIDSCFNRLYQSALDSMTEQESYGLITSLCSVIKDGHTLFYPGEKSTDYHDLHSGFFPFKTWWNGKTLFVAMNYTKTPEIPDGAEIISINRVAAADMMRYILTRMMHDGENQTYPVWVLNNWLMEYYSYFYGHPATFNIVYRREDGAVESKTVGALSKREIFANREKNYPQVTFGKKEKDGLLLEIDNESKTAVLTIRDFHADVLKKVYKQRFKKTINGYFDLIQANGVKNLILDIRNNQGGETRYAKILLSHLLDSPFQLVEEYYKVNRSEAGDPTRRLKKCSGPTQGAYQLRSDAFTGQLYVLVNGGSFSNSGIVSSALRHYGRGTFIGEETGGNPNVLCGSVRYKTLPHTRIRVEIPTLQFVIRDKQNNSGHGVIPEHAIQPDVSDIVRHKDVVKKYTLALIREFQLSKS